MRFLSTPTDSSVELVFQQPISALLLKRYRISWNLKLHCHVYKNKSSVPLLRQMNTVHIFLYDTVIFTRSSSRWPLSFGVFFQNLYEHFSFHACHSAKKTDPLRLYQRNIWRWGQIVKRHILRYLLGLNVLLITLLRVDLTNLGKRSSKWTKAKSFFFPKMLYQEHIYQHTGCNKNNILAYVRDNYKQFK